MFMKLWSWFKDAQDKLQQRTLEFEVNSLYVGSEWKKNSCES